MNTLASIRRTIADFDAIHGRGAAARDLTLGTLASVVLFIDVALLAAVLGVR